MLNDFHWLMAVLWEVATLNLLVYTSWWRIKNVTVAISHLLIFKYIILATLTFEG